MAKLGVPKSPGPVSALPSGYQSPDKDSPEAGASSQSNTRKEETLTADHQPDAQKTSGPVRREWKTSERKGLKLSDYLGEARMAQLLAQRDERRASDDNSGEGPPADEPHDDTNRQNEANALGKDPAAG